MEALNKLSLDKLKALVYDLLIERNNINATMKAAEERIATLVLEASQKENEEKEGVVKKGE